MYGPRLDFFCPTKLAGINSRVNKIAKTKFFTIFAQFLKPQKYLKFTNREALQMNKLKKYIFILIFLLNFGALSAQWNINQFFYRGQHALVEGRYAEAIDNFNILVRLDDQLYEAYFFRGIAKYNLGDFVGAQIDFDQTLAINPIYTPAYHYRAIALSRIGKYDLALKDLAEAVDLRPSYTGLYFSRGVTYFLSQQFEKAIEDFNKFIQKEPREPDAYLNRGASYLYVGDTLKAISDYNKAITLNKFEPEGYIRRARVFQMQKQYEKAIEDLNTAIELDKENTFAYFNRALMRFDNNDINGALDDLNSVLEQEPGNALTLYNRALIRTQIGDYNNALDDYDRVLNINPENVLAYFNRASVFLELGRFREAMDDYSQAINLYPDFAKAYMNRSYVKNQLGQYNSAQADYEIAQKKIAEYKRTSADSTAYAAFADTTRKYDRLLDFDAEFAKRDFNDELLQYRDVDIRLKPLYRFVAASEEESIALVLNKKYSDKRVEDFEKQIPIGVELTCYEPKGGGVDNQRVMAALDAELAADSLGHSLFAKAILEAENRQFNIALDCYGKAIQNNPDEVFYYINRGAIQSEMIDFISSIENNVQVLTLDNAGTAKARVKEQSTRSYDYTAAIHDMKKAASIYPEFPYTYYNLGNLYCQSNDLPEAIRQYEKAISLYPNIGEAYYNKGLVLIYLKDKEKGCIDLSKAGELGIEDAYSVIKKYCTEE